MGKARLAPIKAVTIPRLELTAATIPVHLGKTLKKKVDKTSDIIQYHTDSVTVLCYNYQQRSEMISGFHR